MDAASKAALCSDLLDLFERYGAINKLVPTLAQGSAAECAEALGYLQSIQLLLEELERAVPVLASGAFNTKEADELKLSLRLSRLRQTAASTSNGHW
jgi:hypothetical protein